DRGRGRGRGGPGHRHRAAPAQGHPGRGRFRPVEVVTMSTLLSQVDTLDTLPFLVLLMPLLGFLVLALFGDAVNRDREQKGATLLACAMVVLSFLMAVRIAVKLPAEVRQEHAALTQQAQELAKQGV